MPGAGGRGKCAVRVECIQFHLGKMKNSWKWMMAMVPQNCTVKIVNSGLYIFYHNKKIVQGKNACCASLDERNILLLKLCVDWELEMLHHGVTETRNFLACFCVLWHFDINTCYWIHMKFLVGIKHTMIKSCENK